MSKFANARRKEDDDDERINTALSVMFDHNPSLHECLFGWEEKPGVFRPGCKLSLWAEGPHVKICIKDDHTNEIGFCTLNTELKLSGALEKVLEDGRVEWKEQKPHGRRG